MAEITLVAEPGRPTGSAASRRLRAAGRDPRRAVRPRRRRWSSVSVDGRDLRHALSGEAGLNQLLSVQVGSETHLAMARALQRHPVRHTVVHVDFQIVRRDEIISADVPILMVGEARAVEQEKGMVEQLLNSLTVNATPGRIPPNLEMDISDLTVGAGVRVGELALPEGVTTDLPPEELVVLASVTRAAIEEEAGSRRGRGGGRGRGRPGDGADARAGRGGLAARPLEVGHPCRSAGGRARQPRLRVRRIPPQCRRRHGGPARRPATGSASSDPRSRPWSPKPGWMAGAWPWRSRRPT